MFPRGHFTLFFIHDNNFLINFSTFISSEQFYVIFSTWNLSWVGCDLSYTKQHNIFSITWLKEDGFYNQEDSLAKSLGYLSSQRQVTDEDDKRIS